MKKLLLLSVLVCFMFAEEIEITSQRFEASEKALVSKFIDHVKLKRGKDSLWSDRLYIYFNKKKKPIKFEAVGNVKFDLFDKKGKEYKGSCKKLIYFPKKRVYQLFENVKIVTLPDKREVFGDRIYLDLNTSKVSVEGNKKRPVKMILNIEEK